MNIVILVFIGLAFLMAFYVFVKNTRGKKLDPKDKRYISSHWKEIKSDLKKHPGHAVLNADKLLDYALKKNGFTGSVGEKLKKAGPRFSDLNGIWNAHKLRNRIAHELGDVKVVVAQNALKKFRRGLNDLGASL